VTADDESVAECGSLLGQFLEEHMYALRVSGVELRVGFYLACDTRGGIRVVVEFEQLGRAVAGRLVTDKDATVTWGIGINGAVDPLDVLFEVAGQAPSRHVE